jgi:hypothetical protein
MIADGSFLDPSCDRAASLVNLQQLRCGRTIKDSREGLRARACKEVFSSQIKTDGGYDQCGCHTLIAQHPVSNDNCRNWIPDQVRNDETGVS